MDRTIVTRRCKEWLPVVVAHRPDGQAMVSQRLVRLHRQVEVEPAQPSIVTTKDKVVALGVDIDGRDVLRTCRQFFDQGLGVQVVHTDVRFGGHEEDWFAGVEGNGLYIPSFLKWMLRGMSQQ